MGDREGMRVLAGVMTSLEALKEDMDSSDGEDVHEYVIGVVASFRTLLKVMTELRRHFETTHGPLEKHLRSKYMNIVENCAEAIGVEESLVRVPAAEADSTLSESCPSEIPRTLGD